MKLVLAVFVWLWRTDTVSRWVAALVLIPLAFMARAQLPTLLRPPSAVMSLGVLLFVLYLMVATLLGSRR
jgi:hypothetical protein